MSTVSSSTAIPAGTWSIDPVHSRVGFAVKHMGIAMVRGEFTEFEGTLEVHADLARANAHGTVKVASLDTGDPGRDGHLRSPDFFDAAGTRDCSSSRRASKRSTTTSSESPAS